ncbi:hypothetical protein AB0C07_12780 [Actinoplanes missouriensis]|uniref:hypothetical protein n=1 Tax=Actinoplanes missouriensis TaxID=1866 RepID=UPI0033D83C95
MKDSTHVWPSRMFWHVALLLTLSTVLAAGLGLLLWWSLGTPRLDTPATAPLSAT